MGKGQRCPHCGAFTLHKNGARGRRCSTCGLSLCPHCGKMVMSTIYCINCGKRLTGE